MGIPTQHLIHRSLWQKWKVISYNKMVENLQKLWHEKKPRKSEIKKKLREGPEYPGEGAATTSAAGPFQFNWFLNMRYQIRRTATQMKPFKRDDRKSE